MSNDCSNNHPYRLCHHCDLLIELPAIKHNHKVVCPRCHTKVARCSDDMHIYTIVYSLCALFMLLLSCSFAFVNIRVMGMTSYLDVLQIPDTMYQDHYLFLFLIFWTFVVILPGLSLCIRLLICDIVPLSKRAKKLLLLIYNKINHWCMPEIFIAGVLVSFVKLENYGEISINHSFIAFCLFILLYTKSSISFSYNSAWNDIQTNNFVKKELKIGQTGISQNVRLCLCCHAILPAFKSRCPRCRQKGRIRGKNNIQWVIALLLTSLMLYIPANMFGIMNTVFWGSGSSSTILDGVLYMWQEGDYPVAIIIFTVSITIPILKILALTWLCYFAHLKNKKNGKDNLNMNRLYRVVEFIGRWSMIDIFVVAVISALIKNGDVIAVYPDIGVLFFATVVIVTMFASQKYDPRLIWDDKQS